MTVMLNQGFFFEDFDLNEEYMTSGRTISRTDVVNFAGVSGDFGEIHLDAEVGKSHIFGQNIAHGMCVLAIASGAIARSGLVTQTVAFFGIKDWRFHKPVLFGDTIRVRAKIAEKKETSKEDRGFVGFSIEVINQKDEVVASGRWDVLIARKGHPVLKY